MTDMPPVPSPVDEIFIPASEYTDPAWDAAEREHLWPKIWHMACRESELLVPGDFVNFEILDESILIVRNGEGADDLAAFYNVCQHRGRRLRDEPRGRVGPTLACRFHGWQFTREGELHTVYMEDDWEGCAAYDRSKLSIPKVKLERWGGWVWLNMDPDCEPLESWLGQATQVLAPFHFDEMRPVFWKTLLAPVNWKVVAEAFNEGYHSGATHTCGINYWPSRSPTATSGRHSIFFSEGKGGFSEYKDERGKWVKAKTMAEHIWANNRHLHRTLHAMTLDPALAASERLLDLPEDTDPGAMAALLFQYNREEIEKRGAKAPATMTMQNLYATGTDWHLFPNSIVLPTMDGALWYRIRPDRHDRDACIFDIWSFGRFAPGEEPDAANEVYDGFEAFKGQCEFLEEDFANLQAVNDGMKSRGFRGATLNPHQEGSVSNFHRALREFMGLD
jgi:phenylpropionate dioxygenase-like ring-hydroxylating dioxygenase large terminal subunit